ncbi:MAG: thioredoxin family protein [bacterium]
MRKIFLAGIVILTSVGFCIAAKTPEKAAIPAQHTGVEKPAGIPSLIDLGRTFCIPCKMMAPILEELKKEYSGRFKVEFIDVGKRPEEAKKYAIRAIPTQVFLDASGKELYRHIGFYSKKDILKKWKELGVDLGAPQAK